MGETRGTLREEVQLGEKYILREVFTWLLHDTPIEPIAVVPSSQDVKPPMLARSSP